MKRQPRLDKKWAIISSLAIILLIASAYVLMLPLDTKLRLFCTIDNDHIAETPPTYNQILFPAAQADYIDDQADHIDGYWTNPNTGTVLVVITIRKAVDSGTWLYYDNTENTFWIGIQTGPMKSAFYGPYPGILWTLTSLINPLAIAGITLSIVALVYQPTRKLWTRIHTTNIP